MDDGGRDIPPDEDRLNYVYPNEMTGDQLLNAHDLQEDTSQLNQHPETLTNFASRGIRSRSGFRLQEPVDTTPDAIGSLYEQVFPPQRQTVPNTPDYYKSEANRLATFSDWRFQNIVRREDLAKSGFIYTGTGDKVRCVYCNGVLRQWEQGDIIEVEHRRNFPYCPFISGQNIGNMSYDPAISGPYQFNSVNTAMSDARAVGSVNQGYDIDPIQDRCGASYMPPISQISDLHVCDAVAGKNNSTGDDMSPRRIYSNTPRNQHMSVEPDRLATFSSWPAQMKQKPDELAQAGLYYTGDGDKVKCFHCDGVLFDWDPEDDPFIEHARWFPECQYIKLVKGEKFVEDVKNGRATDEQVMQTPAVLAVLHDGYSVDCVQRALAAMRKKNGVEMVVSAQNLLMTIMELEEDSKQKHMNGHMSSEDWEKLQRENETLRDKQLCKICMERDVEVIFYPCKHFVCCAICSAAVQVCPICRVAIESIDKVFMA